MCGLCMGGERCSRLSFVSCCNLTEDLLRSCVEAWDTCTSLCALSSPTIILTNKRRNKHGLSYETNMGCLKTRAQLLEGCTEGEVLAILVTLDQQLQAAQVRD